MSKRITADRNYAFIRFNRKEMKLLIAAVNKEIPRRKSVADRLFFRRGTTGDSSKSLQQIKGISATLHEAVRLMEGK
jgi:hypothetical protein